MANVQNKTYSTYSVTYFEKHFLVPGCGTETPPTPYFAG